VWDIAAAKKPVAFAWDERNDTAYWGHESATRLFPDPTGRRLAVNTSKITGEIPAILKRESDGNFVPVQLK